MVGESRENVIIDGYGGGMVVKVAANNVDINTFTIRNGSICIKLNFFNNNSDIMNCAVYGNINNGIDCTFYNTYVNVIECAVYGNSGHGIYSSGYSDYGTIIDNIVMSYIIIKPPNDFTMKKGDSLEITLFPSIGITKTIHLKAPLPIKQIVSLN